MEFYRIGGKVTSGGDAVAGATVAIDGAGLAARTDGDATMSWAPWRRVHTP